MRAVLDRPRVTVEPGTTTSVVVDLVNTHTVIDGISARVIGLPAEQVVAHPALLPLFPDAAGQITLQLAVPRTFPAGRHSLTVELVSHGARAGSTYLDLDLVVEARPSLRMAAAPRVVTARRNGRFVLELCNDGNVALDVDLLANEAERRVGASFSQQAVRIPAGTVAPVLMRVRGPRMVTGTEIDRTMTVSATARPVPTPDTAPHEPAGDADAPETPAPLPETREATVRLRQKPMIGRGVMTALILASIVGLWAAAFLLGITKVFSNDPMTKDVPASFFAASQAQAAAAPSAAPGSVRPAAAVSTSPAPPPAGALSKTGELPAGLGGALSGTVIASSNLQPVGRILVTAYRAGRHGLTQVSMAATQSDGSYTLAGLFPTDYYVKFSAAGYHPVWYPGTPLVTKAEPVGVVSADTRTGVDGVVTGLPATVTGSIDLGALPGGTVSTVTARALDAAGTITHERPITVTSTTAGVYTFPHLEAPGRYLFSVVTPGYSTTTLVDSVAGNDRRHEPTVTPGAGAGQITGSVVGDDGLGIGGATVTTTVAGVPTQVTTPTTGQVGAFALTDLPTPGTYVVTATAAGHASVTQVIDLKAGSSSAPLTITLRGGVGTVTGRLVDGNGDGLGGAAVTVTGTATSDAAAGVVASTTTLTAGTVGSFSLTGLPVGQYGLTFTLDGYDPVSVPVTIGNRPAAPLTVPMNSNLGSIVGTVTRGATAYVGATVTATNGTRTWTTTTTGGGTLPDGTTLSPGGYYLTGLPTGSYSVTVTATPPDVGQRTRLVEVRTGAPVTGQDLDLPVGR